METVKQSAAFVAGGGWLKSGAELTRPKTRFAGLANLAWLTGSSLVISVWPNDFVLWIGGIGQAALVTVALVVRRTEKQVLSEKLIPNPEVKPRNLY